MDSKRVYFQRKIFNISIILFCGLLYSPSFGQQELGKINYDFHLNLQNYEEGYIYKAILYYTKSSKSLFIYNSVQLENKKGFRKDVTYKSGDIKGGVFFREFDSEGNKVFQDKTGNSMVSREFLGGMYPVQVNETLPEFNWKITKETKTIGKYLCFKAESSDFRGRNYIAWFTYDIPLSLGPWKFQGLPGLILEVHDDLKQIHITFKNAEFPSSDNISIVASKEKEILTLEEFLNENFRLYRVYLDNQRALIATGRIPRKVTPLPYRAIEYSTQQQKLLNNVNAIVLSD